MTPPSNREEVFDAINTQRWKNRDLRGEKLDVFIEKQLTHCANSYSFMKGVTPADYWRHISVKLRASHKERQQQLDIISRTTPQEFWDAAYDFDPNGAGIDCKDTKLVKMLSSRQLKPMPLGNLYWHENTPLWLAPAVNSLPLSEIEIPNYTKLPAARNDSAAIYYPDGHPSSQSRQEGPQSVHANSDKILRRIWPIGYIVLNPGEDYWKYTGHVLVLDMDKDRDRHPWIVLASHWPDINREGPQGDHTFRAPKQAGRDDPDVYGILPGDRWRTSVAKLCHLSHSQSGDSRPFLKQLGSGFNFGLQRRSGENRLVVLTPESREFHPALAHIMGWHWDESLKEEVCYFENGKEYMRYKPSTGGLRHSRLSEIPIDGRNALYGVIAS